MKLWWDLETYSETPINDGAHRYAENAEILLFAWAPDDAAPAVWDVTEKPKMPSDIEECIAESDEYWGHNSGMFDSVITKHARPSLSKLMAQHKHRDTLVQALCHGLPGSLDALCEIFRLPQDIAKSKRGKQLIRMFCMPQASNSKIRRRTKETNPEEWAEFRDDYAPKDITSMREIHKRAPKWNFPNHEFELRLWQMDQRINNEGIYVDLELSSKAVEAVNAAQTQLASDVTEATDGAVESATQRDRLLKYILAEHKVSLPDMRADTLERRLSDPGLPDGVRELLALRLMASKSSVSKYKRVMRCTSSDGYLRGGIQFCGAGRTGRDAHRLVQMGNMFRPTLPQEEIDSGIEAIKAGCTDLLTDNVMELCANTLRGIIIAPPKKKIVVADLSNIEGRVAAWIAGEQWKLQAFRDFDSGNGPDLYIKTYSESFNVPLKEVTKKLRQIGKVEELMLAYGGGVGAFLTGAATYGIDLDDLAATGRAAIPDHVWAEAENFWNWSLDTKRLTYGLSQETFQVCDSIKRLWRAANPKIAAIWKQLEEATRSAIYNEKEDFRVGMICFRRVGNWLKVRLPSGRFLSYPAPQVADDGTISYMGLNRYSRKWQRIKTYGGMLFENLCQAIARDVLFYRMPAIEEEGYSIRMRVHDELITYAPDGELYNAKHLSQLMATNPSWSQGLPLAAAGFEAYRYKKD